MADSPRQVLENYKEKIIQAFIESLEKNDKVARGLLQQSIGVEIKAFATKFTIEVSMLKYWQWVDAGRKPGGKQPPMEAMLKHIADRGEWQVSKVKSIQNTYKNKKGLVVRRKKPLAADKARRTLAFLIGRKIKKRGLKPTNFIAETLNTNVFIELQRDISEALGREIIIDLNLK